MGVVTSPRDNRQSNDVSTASSYHAYPNKHWLAALVYRYLLIFSNERHEMQFEYSWCEPGMLVQPLMTYHILWYVDFTAHKSLDGVLSNKGQMGLGSVALTVPFITFVACFRKSSSEWVRSHYHSIIIVNVVSVMLFCVGTGVWDQFWLKDEFLCPAKFYACPHHAMDASSLSVTWFSLAYVNIFSACLIKYKIVLNFIIIFLFILGVVAGDTNAAVSGAKLLAIHMVFNTIVIAVGTFYVGYSGEAAFRQSLHSRAKLRAGNHAIETLLLKLLPPRLLKVHFKVPLVETFKGVTVMFCSFGKDAVSHFDAQEFFTEIDEIYSIFDDAVARSGCFKVEHVGEDYVVVTDNVHTGDPLDDTLQAHRTACVKIAELAMELVEIGNAHISESSGSRIGLKFGFKAGLHHGVLSSGILGRSRRFYRIFGDTVVTSARMCQHTEPGTVQISEETHKLLGEYGPPRLPGKPVSTKGKGWLNAFILQNNACHFFSRLASDGRSSGYQESQGAPSDAGTGSGYKNSRGSKSVSIDRRVESISFKRRARVAFVALPDFNQYKDTCAEDGGSIGMSINRQASVAISALYNKTNEEFFRSLSTSNHQSDAEGGHANAVTNSACDTNNVKNPSTTNDLSIRDSEVLRCASGVENVLEQPQEIIEVEFDWLGRFTDISQELRFQERRIIQLCVLSLQCVQASRLMAVFLFSSVGALGTTNGWDMPAGLRWGSTGRQMSFSDVAITSWMWVVQCCLFTLMMFVPPAFNQSPNWLYVQLSMASQSILFGLSCIVAMLCAPSVLTLGIPLAYLAQFACLHLDSRIGMAITAPILAICFAEAMVSGKLVTNTTIGIYILCLVGTLVLIVRHHVGNEKETRRDWIASEELRREKEVMEMILLDMLPRQYAMRMVKNGDCGGGRAQRAIVLFSDLQGYTGLNEKMSAHDVAMVMHGLWCVFDALVQKHGMHKMDTVGDAFIVTGLVEDDDCNLAETACGMIDLARDMIVALQDISCAIKSGEKWWHNVDGTVDHGQIVSAAKTASPDFGPRKFLQPNRETLKDEDNKQLLNIRIGIDVGHIVAGVIGKLQPRFHAHGSVMATAQKLEGACLKGSILISPEMANLLQMRVNSEGVVGYTLPSPMRTHFFPTTEYSTDVDRVATASESTFCEKLLLMTGITSPKKVLSREESKMEKVASVLRKKAKAENVLRGLSHFSNFTGEWTSTAKARAKQVRVYVESEQSLDQEQPTPTLFKPVANVPSPAVLAPPVSTALTSVREASGMSSNESVESGGSTSSLGRAASSPGSAGRTKCLDHRRPAEGNREAGGQNLFASLRSCSVSVLDDVLVAVKENPAQQMKSDVEGAVEKRNWGGKSQAVTTLNVAAELEALNQALDCITGDAAREGRLASSGAVDAVGALHAREGLPGGDC